MSYQVKLEVFEGPFDLLLQLIARRRLDVTEIDLADITADFLAHLGEHLDELDLESATRFLVIAATLVELKAARLLPREERHEVEDLLGEARDMLYARLLEYRGFRDVARILAHRLDQFADSRAREVAPEAWILQLVPDVALPIDAAGLARLAAALDAPPAPAEVDLGHIRRTYLTIRDAARQLIDALPAAGPVEYRSLVKGRERQDRVVLFLAALELFKLGHLSLEQPDLHAPLRLERTETTADLNEITDDVNDEDAGVLEHANP